MPPRFVRDVAPNGTNQPTATPVLVTAVTSSPGQPTVRPRPTPGPVPAPIVGLPDRGGPISDDGGMQAEDRVLLIDVENMIGSVRSRPDLVSARVRALLDAAGPVHHTLACYTQVDPAIDRVASVLAELGVAPWPVPAGGQRRR